jgi:hypothetical protein
VFDHPPRLKFELNEAKMDSPTESEAAKSNGPKGKVAKDPLVKSILDNFEGEII